MRTITVLAWVSLSTPVVFGSEPCIHGCLMELEALQAEYSRFASVRCVVRNVSAETLNVVVVLDELVDGGWRETPLTVSDQDHGFKVVRFSPVTPGAQLVFNYPACAMVELVPRGDGGRDILVSCPPNTPSPSSPFRLHVFVHKDADLLQELVSSPYRVLPN